MSRDRLGPDLGRRLGHPGRARLARRFEADWRRRGAEPRPDPGSTTSPTDPPSVPAPGWPCSAPTWRCAARPASRVRSRSTGTDIPDLGDETLVALLYEEFCLREEDGESPDPAEYLRRFPEVADRLRRVLDIHDLVGSAPDDLADRRGLAVAGPAAAPSPRSARRSAGSTWSRSWAAARSPGSSWPTSGCWPIGRWR